MNGPWSSYPIVGVTMNPIKGSHFDFYAFCDLAVMIRYPAGNTEIVVDARTRCIPPTDEIRRLGEFTSEETIKYKLFGEYAKEAREVADLLKTISVHCRGCIPMAVNAQICKSLLHKSVRIAEGGGHVYDKRDVFVLREKSNWIDLGLWRINSGSERFSVHPVPPVDRLHSAFNRLPVLARELRVPDRWTLKELFAWQGGLVPF